MTCAYTCSMCCFEHILGDVNLTAGKLFSFTKWNSYHINIYMIKWMSNECNGALLGQLLLTVSWEAILLCKCKWETTSFSYTQNPRDGVCIRGTSEG